MPAVFPEHQVAKATPEKKMPHTNNCRAEKKTFRFQLKI